MNREMFTQLFCELQRRPSIEAVRITDAVAKGKPVVCPRISRVLRSLTKPSDWPDLADPTTLQKCEIIEVNEIWIHPSDMNDLENELRSFVRSQNDGIGGFQKGLETFYGKPVIYGAFLQENRSSPHVY